MYKSLVVAASAITLAAAFQGEATFSGDATFYGAGGAGSQGACMLEPGFNNVGVTVSMNKEQYPGSCGKCITLTGKGEGDGASPVIGPIFATVDNECADCKHGDIELGLSGDGRWRIDWEFVQCDHAAKSASHVPGSRKGSRRQLRGAADAGEEGFVLPTGSMVTAEGVRLIADVQAQQQQNQAAADGPHEPQPDGKQH